MPSKRKIPPRGRSRHPGASHPRLTAKEQNTITEERQRRKEGSRSLFPGNARWSPTTAPEHFIAKDVRGKKRWEIFFSPTFMPSAPAASLSASTCQRACRIFDRSAVLSGKKNPAFRPPVPDVQVDASRPMPCAFRACSIRRASGISAGFSDFRTFRKRSPPLLLPSRALPCGTISSADFRSPLRRVSAASSRRRTQTSPKIAHDVHTVRSTCLTRSRTGVRCGFFQISLSRRLSLPDAATFPRSGRPGTFSRQPRTLPGAATFPRAGPFSRQPHTLPGAKKYPPPESEGYFRSATGF